MTGTQSVPTPSTTPPSPSQTASPRQRRSICQDWKPRCAGKSARKVCSNQIISPPDYLSNISHSERWMEILQILRFPRGAWSRQWWKVGEERRGEREKIKNLINCRYCIHRSGTYNIHVEYCTCRKKDGCNGKTGLAGSWTLISFLLVVLSVRSRNLVR